MTTVGEYYSEATETRTVEAEYGGHPVTIKYNHWAKNEEHCVTQEIGIPPVSVGQYSVYEWLCQKMAEARALEEEGFTAIEKMDDAIIWSRSVKG